MRTLFIRNLPHATTVDSLCEFLAKLGVPVFRNCVSLPLCADGPLKGKSKGFAFVLCPSPEDAWRAVKQSRSFLQGRAVHILLSDEEMADPKAKIRPVDSPLPLSETGDVDFVSAMEKMVVPKKILAER